MKHTKLSTSIFALIFMLTSFLAVPARNEKKYVGNSYNLFTQTQARKQRKKRIKKVRVYIKGPKGGCYYINSKGRKIYVSRTLCN